MAKHPRKKQKLAQQVQPLGSVPRVDDDAEKDDEERRLESILFGKDFKPSGKEKGTNVVIVSDEEDEEIDFTEGGGKTMEQLQDADLFFVDEPPPPSTLDDLPDFTFDTDSFSEGEAELGNFVAVDAEDGPEDTELIASTSAIKQITQAPSRKSSKPAWVDPDDATLHVSLVANKRLRKLRDAPAEDEVGGTQYEARLRREFERINPAPPWAASARKKVRGERKRERESGGDIEGIIESDRDEVEVDELLTRTDGILATERGTRLEKGVIGIERLRDANQSAKAEGEIKALSFHPSPRVPVLMTASVDRRVRLFNIDGHTNPHLQTLHIPALPITHATFHPSGSSLLLTGPRPFYYTFDLQSGATTRSPRGLWGTNPAQSGVKAADLGMELCAFDPSGSILAVAGRRGYVHLVDWRSGGAQVVGSVKMNAGVQGLWWNRHPSIDGAGELMTLGADAEVYVWDVGERRCVKRWKEEGGYGTTTMSGDASGRYLSIGYGLPFPL
ncbi:WD40 repeat-like protein [Phellopilus nigrolimitatus]|nr:WD40 repeat-like protein [Phellopilus nigrolimitatus]